MRRWVTRCSSAIWLTLSNRAPFSTISWRPLPRPKWVFLHLCDLMFSLVIGTLGKDGQCSVCYLHGQKNRCTYLRFARRHCRSKTKNAHDRLRLSDGKWHARCPRLMWLDALHFFSPFRWFPLTWKTTTALCFLLFYFSAFYGRYTSDVFFTTLISSWWSNAVSYFH